MKLTYRFLVVLAFVCLCTSASAQDPCSQGTAYRNCQACGTAKSVKGQTLNVQKNRDDAATAPKPLKLVNMRNPKFNTKFSPDDQVVVSGYVASVVPGGFEESCNCGRDDLRDIHINVVANPNEVNDQSKYVVVEFTPRWEKNFGLNDGDYQGMLTKVRNKLLHKWVQFEGWMLYDYIHANAAKSTKPDQPTCRGILASGLDESAN